MVDRRLRPSQQLLDFVIWWVVVMMMGRYRGAQAFHAIHYFQRFSLQTTRYGSGSDVVIPISGYYAQIKHPSRLFGSTKSGISEPHRKSYQLQGATTPKNKSGVTVSTNTGHTLHTDLPEKMGGKDTAPQPIETLLTALAGCTQATAIFVGRHMQPERLVLDRLEFDLAAARDERGALQLPLEDALPVPSRLQQVTGTVRVYAVNNQAIGPAALELLKEQTELRCPVANMMIASGCRMDVDWVDGNTVNK